MSSATIEARPSGTANQRVYLTWLVLRNLYTSLTSGLTEGQMSERIDSANEDRKSLRLIFRKAQFLDMRAEIKTISKALFGKPDEDLGLWTA